MISWERCGLAFIPFSDYKASEIKEFCDIKGQSVTKIKIKDNNYINVSHFFFHFLHCQQRFIIDVKDYALLLVGALDFLSLRSLILPHTMPLHS